jgi:hypothetical protein
MYQKCISEKTQIYSFGVVPETGSISYLGYRDPRQLGQYYSFTINGKTTRLYTSVNFLNVRNLERMNELLDTKRNPQMKFVKGQSKYIEL